MRERYIAVGSMGAVALERMRAMSANRASVGAAAIAVLTIVIVEIWTYAGARRKEKRNSVWVWSAVIGERDGGRWMDFEVGGRDASTLMRL